MLSVVAKICSRTRSVYCNIQNVLQWKCLQGVLILILDTIDKFSEMESLPNFAGLIGEDYQSVWEEISTYLYLLVAAMIKGNHANCAQFAAVQRLDWLFGRLSNPQSAEGILGEEADVYGHSLPHSYSDVLYCVLTESPEALNTIGEGHIKSVISLLEKVGRDPKVLDVLSSLCEGPDRGECKRHRKKITEEL